MKSPVYLSLLLSFLLSCQYSQSQQSTSLNTTLDSVSYSIGVNVATRIKQEGIKEINAQALATAVQDVITGNELKITNSETDRIITQFLNQQRKMISEATRQESEKFLELNKSQEGIVVLPSGLQYQVLKEGTGAKPTATNTVKTHYHGTLPDGTVFDSSVDRGIPASFPVNGVIAGWTEALQLMSVGSKWKLFIPANLAYGDRGGGALIKPGQALIFEVELLEITK